MMKKWLSVLACVAMLLSCISGITIVAAAEGLPEPYAWFNTASGTLVTNRTMSTTGGNGSLEVVPIPNTTEYGIRLNGDWSGFWLDAAFVNEVPEDKSVTMVVEYYVDKDFAPTDGNQLFRYQAYPDWCGGTSAGDGNKWTNIFTTGLQCKQDSLFYYTFTAEDRLALQNNPAHFAIVGCGWSAGAVYIKSARLVDTAYVTAANNGGYAVWDTAEKPVCEYYPAITMSVNRNVSTFAEGGDYMHFALSGNVLATDRNANKPVYIQLYAKEGYENSTITIENFEAYTVGASRWACNNGYARPQITMTDGVGGILLPETSFTNANNGGSFRFAMAEFQKVARVEVYDVNTFCKNVGAAAADVAAIHAVTLAHNLNITKVGREEATEEKDGYTGDTVCAVCDAVLETGVTIPKIDPNKPLCSLDTAGGTLAAEGCTVAAQGAGSTDVVAIGDSGEYGIVLPADWAGIVMDGISMISAGGKMAMLIEYYFDKPLGENHQTFRYKIGDRPHVDVFVASHNLVSKKSGLIYHVFSEEEMAAIGDGDFAFRIMGCTGGAGSVYVQSVKLVPAAVLNVEMDAGYAYTAFEEQTLTDLYPDVTVAPSYGMGFGNLEKSTEHPEWDWAYRYLTVERDYLNCPVYIKLYAAEGHENDTVTIGAIERVAGVFGEGVTVQMTDGVGSVYIPLVNFTNGMNGVGSLRLGREDAEKISRIEIMDVLNYCGRTDADETLVTQFHEGFRANRVNVNIVGKKDATEEEAGYTGDVYCATCNTLLAVGTEIPKLEASDLPTPYAYFTAANGTLKTVGMTLAKQGVDPVALPIGGSGEYGIKLTGDWQGFRMEGMSLPTDKELTVVIEYYINADLTGSHQVFRYQSYAAMPGVILPDGSDNHYDDIFTDQDSLVCRKSGLLVCPLTPEAVAGINSGNSFNILGCAAGTDIVYIQSVRVIDSEYVFKGEDPGYDFISFEDAPLCAYYPTITGRPAAGITVTPTSEGVEEETGEEKRYGYFKVTRSLVEDGQIFRPVVIRFTFKEDSPITHFNWQYQGARRADPSNGTEWSHQSTSVENGVAEIVLTTACFANELNGLGSFRVNNRDSEPVLDNLLKVEVLALADTSALQALVDGVDAAVVGKTTAAAAAYRALVAEKAVLLEDMWVTDATIAAAVAEIEAAAAALTDCVHNGETKLVGKLEVKNHVVPGYTGDTVCAECNALLEKGEDIPAHETEIRNAQEATCKAPGNTGDRWCVECDELVTAGNAIMQLPHEWDDGVVTRPATPNEKGELTVTCTVCGATKVTRLDFVAAIGDVDENGKVDSTDARLVLQFAVKKIAPSALKLKVADVDENGKVDSTDARLILQYAVKKIDTFPKA